MATWAQRNSVTNSFDAMLLILTFLEENMDCLKKEISLGKHPLIDELEAFSRVHKIPFSISQLKATLNASRDLEDEDSYEDSYDDEEEEEWNDSGCSDEEDWESSSC